MTSSEASAESTQDLKVEGWQWAFTEECFEQNDGNDKVAVQQVLEQLNASLSQLKAAAQEMVFYRAEKEKNQLVAQSEVELQLQQDIQSNFDDHITALRICVTEKQADQSSWFAGVLEGWLDH